MKIKNAGCLAIFLSAAMVMSLGGTAFAGETEIMSEDIQIETAYEVDTEAADDEIEIIEEAAEAAIEIVDETEAAAAEAETSAVTEDAEETAAETEETSNADETEVTGEAAETETSAEAEEENTNEEETFIEESEEIVLEDNMEPCPVLPDTSFVLTRVLRPGMYGDDVLYVQQLLRTLGYLPISPDGIYGSYSVAAVTLFQLNNGLTNPDGMVGNWTMSRLNGCPAAFTPLSTGSYGGNVLLLQNSLKSLGYLSAVPDGIFGNQTKKAVRLFQLFNSLDITGNADILTMMSILRNTGLPYRILELGDTGYDVAGLQKRLVELGYLNTIDGGFGMKTEDAVKLFQLYNNLSVDGAVGRESSGALIENAKAFTDLSYGMSGDAVKLFQTILNSKGYLSATPDGWFGNMTKNAVILFQTENLLEVTGKIDTKTALLLYGGDIPASRTLRFGDSGNDVKAMQQKLRSLGYTMADADGVYGNKTYAAVYAFQAACGMSVPDGAAGNWTKSILYGDTAPFRAVTAGSGASEIYALEYKLAGLGLLDAADGVFDDNTAEAVKKFQAACGIAQSGAAGIDMLLELYAYTPNPAIFGQFQVDETLNMAISINNELGNSLYAAFLFAASGSYAHHETGNLSYDQIPAYCAQHKFTHNYGDCYCMASSFYYLAKALGYDAHVIMGRVPYRSGGYGAHCWVEINMNGSVHVFDPQFHNQYGRDGYDFYYGQSGTWQYLWDARIN